MAPFAAPFAEEVALAAAPEPKGLLQERQGLVEPALAMSIPHPAPHAEDRLHAAELWLRLANLPESQQLAVVRVAREFQTWALSPSPLRERSGECLCLRPAASPPP